jgi:hypothetical protein
VVELREDLALATNREALTRRLGVEPAEWQQRILRSEADRVLLNCSRQSGKITMVAIIALHRALYHPGSLILCLAPALRQSQELFGKISRLLPTPRATRPGGCRTTPRARTHQRFPDSRVAGHEEDHTGVLRR